MKTRVDALLRRQATDFQLRFTCESCAHYAVDAKTCVNGYPNAAHRAVELSLSDEIEFCKEYELV